MAQRSTGRPARGTAMMLVIGMSGLAAGCSNDSAILTGPTPAGVTVPGGLTTVAGSAASSTTVASNGPAPAEVVVALELKVRQAAGGCWESFAPGAPAAVSRQDLWFASSASCSGNGWSLALQVFGDATSLDVASRVPTTAALLRQGTVLVVVAPSTATPVRTLLARQPGFSAIPRGGVPRSG